MFLALSLLLNAVIQTAQNKLSLLDAIVVTYYFFVTSGNVLNPLTDNGSREDRVLLWDWLTIVFAACFGAWWIFLTRNAEHFGAQPECNDKTIIVILWISIRATVPWLRILSFVIAGILLFMVAVVILLFCVFTDIWKGQWPVKKWERNPWICSRILDFVKYVIPHVFLISWIELTIHRNNIGPGANEWSFGQTMGAMLYLFAIVSFLMSLADPGALQLSSRSIDCRRRCQYGVISVKVSVVMKKGGEEGKERFNAGMAMRARTGSWFSLKEFKLLLSLWDE